tara:strand:- start:1641 stop:2900 length:1260 start_codon:yes stop_codon:yes gene_type:complete
MRSLLFIKKILLYTFYLIIISSVVYLIFFINTQDPDKKRLRKELRSIVKKNTIIKHLYNDYREEFLPDTQFIKVNYKKIDLDFLNLNGCYFGECYTFFIEQYEDKIIIIERGGEIKISSFDNLEVKNPKFQNLDSNLNFEYILDTLVHENEIFVTGKNIVGEKTFIEIVKGKYNENEIEFKSIIKLESEGCILRNSVHSGKIQIFENNKNKILISINSAGQLDEPKLDSLNADSICGKILLVNAENNNYEIFSSGHRNIIGLYADGNLVLSTEHGPFAGDEINKIEKGKKYGWPVVSYGEKYSRDKKNINPTYKKSHSDNGFEEPIFSFIPAIGISEIIKLPNNFSNLWQNNFLVASLNGKYLYRIKFDNSYNKIIYYEPIYIGDRIRDLIYNVEKKKIYLALELEGALGIISTYEKKN